MTTVFEFSGSRGRRLGRVMLAGGMVLLAATACARRPVVSAATDTVVAPSVMAPGASVNSGAVAPAILPGTRQDFVVNVGDRVFFDLDSHTIRSDAFARLDAQARWLQQFPQVMVRIEGNADERGTREYNLALGARRANAIRNYLVDRGVSASRIDTISYGKERPIATGSTEASFAQNRNGHTAIISGAQ